MVGFGLKRLVDPASEPVSLAEMKAHLKVDIGDEDDLIASLTSAGREYAETATGRSLMPQTWRLSLDYFPGFVFGSTQYEDWPLFEDTIRLPRACPLISIVSVQYFDPTITLVTLDPSKYQADGDREPARLRPAVGQIWPVTYAGYFGARFASVQVTYTAGYADAKSVPQGIKAAIKLMVGNWYWNRESTSNVNLSVVPLAVESLLAMHTIGKYY